MAMWTRQSMAGKTMGVDGRPLKIKTTWKKSLWSILPQTHVTHQIGIFRDP
jgi:hypothetical protein